MALFIVDDAGAAEATDGVLTFVEALARARQTDGADVIRFAQGIETVAAPRDFVIAGSVIVDGDTDGDGLADVLLDIAEGGATDREGLIRFDAGGSGAASLVLRDIAIGKYQVDRSPMVAPPGSVGQAADGEGLTGQDARDEPDRFVFFNAIDLTLEGVRFTDIGSTLPNVARLQGGTGGEGRAGADGQLGTLNRLDEDGEDGLSGGRGGTGGDGADWALMGNTGQLTLIDSGTASSVSILGTNAGAGGVGGRGGDGGAPAEGAFRPFGGDGGPGGPGGDGGDGGDAILGFVDLARGETSVIGGLGIGGSTERGFGGAVGPTGEDGTDDDDAVPTQCSGGINAPEVVEPQPGEVGMIFRGLIAADGTRTAVNTDFLVYARALSSEVGEGGQARFAVIRTGDTRTDLAVDWSLSGAGITSADLGGGMSGQVTFGRSGPDVQVVTIDIAEDGRAEGDERLTFTLESFALTSVSLREGDFGTRTATTTLRDEAVQTGEPVEPGDVPNVPSDPSDPSDPATPSDPPPGGGGLQGPPPAPDDGVDPPGGGGPSDAPDDAPSPSDGSGDGPSDGPGPILETVLTGTDGPDRLRGGNGDDAIEGRGGPDRLFGFAGADSLSGEDGNDLLVGGPGRDTLDGGAGSDSLSGGGDVDRLIGGSGDDYFALVQGELGAAGSPLRGGADRIDTIMDFEEGDRIAIDDRLVGLGGGRIEVRDVSAADAFAILSGRFFGLVRDPGADASTIFYNAPGDDTADFSAVLRIEGVRQFDLEDFVLF